MFQCHTAEDSDYCSRHYSFSKNGSGGNERSTNQPHIPKQRPRRKHKASRADGTLAWGGGGIDVRFQISRRRWPPPLASNNPATFYLTSHAVAMTAMTMGLGQAATCLLPADDPAAPLPSSCLAGLLLCFPRHHARCPSPAVFPKSQSLHTKMPSET